MRATDKVFLFAPMALDLNTIGYDVEQRMMEDRAGEELVNQAFHLHLS